MLDLSKRWFVRYGLAALTVGLALLTTLHIDLIATSTPFGLFFAAVVGTTWYGGRLPGFVALILSVIVCDYFIIPPYYEFVPGLPDAFKIATFIAVSFFLVMVVAGMHNRERSIRASESRYRTLFEYAPDGIIIASPEGYYLDANASMGRMLGYSPRGLIGMQASDIVVKAEMVHIGDALDEFKPETEHHREVEFRRKNGSVFVGDVTVTTMPNGNSIAVIRDGTDRIHSETTLRQSQKRLADAQRLAHIGSWEWDLKTNFLAWSDEHYRIFGLLPSDSDIDLSLEGIFSKCVHAEDVEDLNTAVERSRKTLQPFSLDFRVIHPDGSIHTIHSLGSVSVDERGIATSMHGTAQDVTEIKRAESVRGVISEILQGVATTRNLDEFLKLVHRAISQVVYAENCFVMLHDPETDTVHFEFWVDKKDPQPRPKRRGTGFASYVLRTGLPLRLTSEATKKLQQQGEAEVIGSSSASWLGVPLRTSLRTIGVLVLQHYEDENAYSERDLEFLSSVGDQIALAIDRKRAEDALSQSNERFRQLADNISEVFWITSPDFATMHYVSAAYELIWGRSAESLYAHPHQWIECIVPAERESAFAQFESLMGTTKEISVEYRIDRPDGTVRWIHDRGFQVRDVSGKLISITGIASDITDRKLAEAALEESEASFKSLFNTSNDAILVLNEGIFLACNPRAEILFGCGKQDLVGNSPAAFSPQEQPDGRLSSEKAFEYMEAAMMGVPQFFEWKHTRLDGTPFDAEVSLNRVDFGGATLVQGTVRDITERKLANAALNESNEKFHQLADNITDAFWIRSPDMNKIYYISPAYEQIWGRTLEGNYAHPHAWYEFIVPEDRQYVKEAYKKLMGDFPKMEIEYRIIRPDGERRWVCSRGFQVRNGTGEIVRLAGITTDITDKKHSDDKLGESETRYRTLFEMSPDAVGMFDLDMNVLVANSRSAEIFGYATVDEMNGKNAFDLIASENLERSRDNIRGIFESGYLAPIESVGVRADGSRIAVEFSATLIRNSDGSPQAVLGVTRDITERNLVEQKLRSSEELLAKSQEIAHLGSWDLIIPEKGNINEGHLRWSDEVYRIFGYGPKQIEVTNDAFFTAVHPDDRAQVSAAMAKALAGGSHYRIDHRILRPDGSERFVHEHSEIIRDKETGKPLKMVGTIQDITGQKLLGEQLRQSQKMEAIGVLAGGIAHDFNNLLTAINGYSDLTLRKMSPDDPLRLNIEEVRNAGTRAAELTSQLLTFSRKQVLRSAVINLNTVVSNIEKMLRRIIRESIELRAVLDPQLRNVRADPGQIEQVIMNLAINARDAMPTGGTLTIETENVFIDKEYVSQHVSVTPGNFVKMTVTDTGEGMTVQTLDHIFEPFFTTKVVGKGTGLGLSTVYGIITQSGGDINVQSEPGHGATFKIYLPCVDEIVEKPKWLDITDEKYLGTETILLVEDEAIVRRLVGEILKSNGYHILEAADGEAALSLCRSYTKRIDMLLTDMIMPNMGGSELRDKVVELLPDIKVLFMSGYTDDSIVHRGILDSHIEFIEKPFTPDGLSRKVREVLES